MKKIGLQLLMTLLSLPLLAQEERPELLQTDQMLQRRRVLYQRELYK